MAKLLEALSLPPAKAEGTGRERWGACADHQAKASQPMGAFKQCWASSSGR